jgi:hypothetical protein
MKLSLIREPINTCYYAKKYLMFNVNNIYYKNENLITKLKYSLGIYFLISLFNYNLSYFNYLVFHYGTWCLLGVFSTIGLGTGVHTGLAFVIPFISNIYSISKECNSTNFEILGNNTHICLNNVESNNLNYDIFMKCFPAVFFWCLCSGLGELPPYYMAYTINDKLTFDSYFGSLGNSFILEKLLEFTKKYSFITILLFATWPNMTFDMCGIACGYCKISIFIFLSATIIGKSFIKTPIQLALFIKYFGEYIPNNNTGNFVKFGQYLIYLFTIYIFKIFIETLADYGAKLSD